MKTTRFQRLLSLLLVVCMVWSMIPAFSLPVFGAADTPTTVASEPIIVVAGSDFQQTNAGTTVTNILNNIKGQGYSSIDGLLFAGDYSNGWDMSYFLGETGTGTGFPNLKTAINSAYSGLADSENAIYIQGNHDAPEAIEQGYLSASGANDTDNYGVFVIHEDDFKWSSESTQTGVITTANKLQGYLNAKIAENYTKPIFVVSHVPLHFTMRTVQNGDSRYANYIFDVLNKAGGMGLNIIFMYGHNHSASWEDSHGGTAVFYTKGDTINIAQSSQTVMKEETLNFTYMNAGYVGYYDTPNSGVQTTLNMSLFEITDDTVTISRYTSSGTMELKAAGVPNTGYTTHTESDYFQPNTDVVASPQTIQLNKTIDATTGDMGVVIQGGDITSVTVTLADSQIPKGYSYYQTYDITATGHTEGTEVIVHIPQDDGIDESRPVFVIDQKKGKIIQAQLLNGNVVFTTDHFSMYTVAQSSIEPTTSQWETEVKYLRTVLTGEGLTEGIPYVITESTLESGALWMVTGTSATKETSGVTSTGLLIDAAANPYTSHVWYFDGTYIRYGKADGKYLNMSKSGSTHTVVLSDTVDEAASAVPIQLASSRRFNFQRADETAIYLNRYGGTATDNVALTYTGYSTSRWYVHEVVTSKVKVSAVPSHNVMTLSETVQMAASATLTTTAGTSSVLGTEETSDVTVTWESLDTSIATVDANGLVTPVKQGQVYIRATLNTVNGMEVTTPQYVNVLLTVVAVTEQAHSITASTHFGYEKANSNAFDGDNLTPGGPYVIVEYFSNWILNDKEMNTATEGYYGTGGYAGLEMLSYLPLYDAPLWDLDEQGLKVHDGTEYLYYDDSIACLGTAADGGEFYTIVNSGYGASNDWNIYYIKSPSAYLYFRSGIPHNVATKSGSSKSYWKFYSVLPDIIVDLTISPGRTLLSPGGTMTLTPTVKVDSTATSTYQLEWSSSDNNVVLVDSNGKITGVNEGRATISITLTSVNGRTLSAPLTVECDVQVGNLIEVGDTLSTALTLDYVMTLVKAPVEGQPYVISSNEPNAYNMVWTNMFKYAPLDSSYYGIDMEPVSLVQDQYQWYIEKETVDGVEKTYIRYGSLEDENNYVSISSSSYRHVVLGPKSAFSYDLLEYYDDGSYRPYVTTYARYLNQHGGSAYDTAVGTSSFGNQVGSRWRFNTIQRDVDLAFYINPESYAIRIGESLKLNPQVQFDNLILNTSNYVVEYTSADPSIAKIVEGTVFAVSPGTVDITIRLLSVKGDISISGLSLTVPVTVHDITSITVNNHEGYLPMRASTSTNVKALSADQDAPMMTVNYADGTSETMPLTSNLLKTASGDPISTVAETEYENLHVVYRGVTGCEDFYLKIIPSHLPDYPVYPNEGAVMLDKNAQGVDFQNSGLAKVELSVSGIPARKGVDVIVMLDTSSSMSNKIPEANDDMRINVLCTSLNNLITSLQSKTDDMDIRISVADFNGNYADPTSPYYISDQDILAGSSRRAYATTNYIFTQYTDADKKSMADYVPGFMNVEDLGENPFTTAYNYQGETSGKYSLIYRSGTNYDYAFDTIYQLGQAANDVDARNGEYRELFVVFMSDGAPFQYNYYSSYSGQANWNNWLLGTMTDEMYGENADRSFYNPDGKHWMAEAIKGSREEMFPVIRKNDVRDEDGDNWITVAGLGATMYTVGYCLKDDGQIPIATQQACMTNLATSSEYVKYADTPDELDNAFDDISAAIINSASGAFFDDQMGDDFNLKLGNHQYDSVDADGNVTATTFSDNKIQIKRYEIYTLEEYNNCLRDDDTSNDFSIDLVGTRKLDANGNEIFELLEEVTFNADGTEAYSNQVFSSGMNILISNVIQGKYFIYNGKSSSYAVDTDGDGDTDFDLAPESFYWKIDKIETTELVLSYYVCLEENVYAGVYPTNDHATLYYTNYLGNKCQQDAPIPILAWGKGVVGYGLYLVDKNGNPIQNVETGTTTSFRDSVKIGNVQYQEFDAGDAAITIDKNNILNIPGTYKMYDSAAKYKVKLDSNGNGQFWLYSDGKGKQTTYVTGVKSDAFTNGTVAGYTETTTGYATANTVVWFAIVSTVEAKSDTVVLDFGLPVDIHPLTNDTGSASIVDAEGNTALDSYLAAIGNKTNLEFTKELTSDFVGLNQILQLTYGKAEILNSGLTNADDAVIRYTLQTLNMPDLEAFSYALEYTGESGTPGYYLTTVNVIPATTIYFEDNITDKNDESAIKYSTWTVTTDADGNVTEEKKDDKWSFLTNTDYTSEVYQDEDIPGVNPNVIYGTDSNYANGTSVYSMQSCNRVLVTPTTSARANFTFTGTGFDLVSICSNNSGAIMVTVTDSNGKSTYYFVDLYYGYDYVNGEWTANPDNSMTLYQVPVIKVDGLAYGKYDVEIYAAYNEYFDHDNNGQYIFIMDGIRIYNPAGTGVVNGDTTIRDAYVLDGEYDPTYQTVRDILINPDNFVEGTTIDGAVFIDGVGAIDGSDPAQVVTYANYGPANEVYLMKNQSIAFDMAYTGNICQIQLGLKCITSAAKVRVYGIDADGNRKDALQIIMKTCTEMYYNISNLNNCTVVIENYSTGDNAYVSVTNIKTTHYPTGTTEIPGEGTEYGGGITMSMDSAERVLAFMNNTSAVVQPNITLSYPSVSFEDEIIYNVYFNVDDTSSIEEMGMITFDSKLDSGTVEDAVDRIPGVISGDGIYMARTNGIPAKNMGDLVYFKVYAKLTDGTYVYSNIAGYNAVAYANTVLASDDAKAKALVVAMLNYGAAAQVQFGYNTDNLMNAAVTAEQQALVSGYSADMIDNLVKVDAEKGANFVQNASGFISFYPSVSFEGAFAINYYVGAANAVDGEMTFYYWDVATLSSVDQLTVDNATGSSAMVESNGQFWAQISGIAAKQIDETIVVAVVYESNGVSYCTGLMSYSLGAYCLDLADSENAIERDFAQATAVYGYYAKTFFAN